MPKPTPKKRVLFVRRSLPVMLVFFGVFSLLVFTLRTPVKAYATAADTVNFQARLQSSSGAIVPDGYYNLEFKLYSASTGGSPLWTEDYLNTSSQGLSASNGYVTAQLGSITAFPSTIDWSQQLYLTINVGGTSNSGPVTWDGEMSPRLALTATPYAFQAGSAAQAGELSSTSGSNVATLSIQAPTSGNQTFIVQDQGASGTYDLLTTQAANNSFIQLQTGTPSQQTGSLDISGSAIVGNVQATSYVLTPNVDTASAGALSIGPSNATSISLGNTTSNIATTINGTAIVKPTSGHDSTTAFQVQNSSAASVLSVNTSSSTVNVLGNSAAPTYVNEWDNFSSGRTTLSVSPATAGDLMVMGVKCLNDCGHVASVSGGGVTTWNLVKAFTSNEHEELWEGTVTTTGASTVTVTYTATPSSNCELAVEEFTAGLGASTNWTVETSGTNSGSSATANYPSLTATQTNGLYFGYSWGGSNATGGSTSGFTYYTTSNHDELIYNPTTTNGTTYSPTSTLTSSAGWDTLGMIIAPSVGGLTDNNTLTVGGTSTFSNGVTVQAGGNAAAFQVQNATGSNLFNVDASGNNVNIGATGTTALSSTVNIATSTGASQTVHIGDSSGEVSTVTLGSASSTSTTTVQSGSGGVSIQAGVGNVNIQTTNAGTVMIGNTGSNNTIVLQQNGISQTLTGSASAPSDVVKTTTNSTAAFQVQNASASSIFNVNTSNGIVGTAATAISSTNSNAFILQTGNATGSTSNSGNMTIDSGTATSTAGTLNIGIANTPTINIGTYNGDSGTKGTAIHIGDTTNASSAQTVTVGSAASNTSDTTLIQGGTGSSAVGIQAGTGGTISVGTANADIIAIGNTGSTNALTLQGSGISDVITGSGSAPSDVIKTTTNSTAAFQVQNSSSSALFDVDTANSAIVLGPDGTTSNITVRGGVATGSNVTGSNITFQASNGTGSAGSGSIIFQTAASSVGTIGVDNTGTTYNFTATQTLSFTTGSEANRFMLVTTTEVAGNSVSSLTYDGVALTKITSLNTPNSGAHIEMWGLIAPPSGTFNVVANLAGADGGIGVTTYYNVNQTTPYGTAATNSGTTSGAGSSSVSTTTSNSNQLVADGIVIDNISPDLGSPGSGQIQRWIIQNGSGIYSSASSTKPGTGSTVTTTWNMATSVDWAGIGVPLNAVSNGTSTTSDTMSNTLVVANNGVQIQNSSGVALLNANTSTNNITINGSLSGLTDVDTETTTGTNSYTETSADTGYYLTSSVGNTTTTDTFNITGVPNTEGTIVFIGSQAIRSTGTAIVTTNVQINGTQISTVATTSTSGAQTVKENYIAMYINGGWRIMGYGLGSNVTQSTSDTADYAEWIDYSGDTAPQPGDVLTVGDDATSVKDSTTPYDNHVIGVVSTSPYQVGGSDDGHSVVMVLTGRVPVNVSLENGPIEPGDPLTSSSTPGVAMKATGAGQIIGTALEAYDGTQTSNQINVQLHVGYNDPNPGTIQGDANVGGGLYVGGDASIEGNLTVVGTTSTQNLSVSGMANLAILTVSGGVTADSATVVGAVSSATLSVSGDASFGGDIAVSGHFITGGTTPTTAVNTATAGSTATCTVTGNDTSGTISLQSQGTGQAAGTQCTLTFNKAFGNAPRAVVSPDDSLSAAMGAYLQSTPSTMTLNFTSAPAAGRTYSYNYFAPQ